MTLTEFDHGYWYATELKHFAAKTLGIAAVHGLRKDELEKTIRSFLTTGKIQRPAKRRLARSRTRDVEQGLSLDLLVATYVNDKQTKEFLETEARKRVPGLKRKSGVRYRFNRWREEQLSRGVKLTYGDLVTEYVRLNQTAGPFTRIPIVCYVNFVSDFLAAEQGATREQALKAWQMLKRLDAPNTYRAWVRVRDSRSR